MKKVCRIHSYVYSGHQCPICVQERSKHMSDLYEKRHAKMQVAEQAEKIQNLDWSDLATKFNVSHK